MSGAGKCNPRTTIAILSVGSKTPPTSHGSNRTAGIANDPKKKQLWDKTITLAVVVWCRTVLART